MFFYRSSNKVVLICVKPTLNLSCWILSGHLITATLWTTYRFIQYNKTCTLTSNGSRVVLSLKRSLRSAISWAHTLYQEWAWKVWLSTLFRWLSILFKILTIIATLYSSSHQKWGSYISCCIVSSFHIHQHNMCLKIFNCSKYRP